jgi:hypothetical protein
VGPVNSVCFTSGSAKVLSCGDDGQLVATTVDGSLREAFVRELLHLVDSSSGTGGTGPGVLDLLRWHLEQGILQVGNLL